MLVILHCAHLKLATFAEYEECDRGKRTMVRMCGGEKYLAMLVCYSNNEQRTKWREESSWRHVFLYRTKLLQKQNSYTMRAVEKKRISCFCVTSLWFRTIFIPTKLSLTSFSLNSLVFLTHKSHSSSCSILFVCNWLLFFSYCHHSTIQCLLYARYSSLVCRICHSMRIMSDTFCITLQGEKLLKNNV